MRLSREATYIASDTNYVERRQAEHEVIHPEEIKQMNVVMNEDNYLLRTRRFADRLIVADWQAVPVAEKYALFGRETGIGFK
jgi:hypothetical protein